MTVKWWAASDPKNPVCDPSELKSLLSDKTRLVACPHASNITGTISPIRKIADTVHVYPRVSNYKVYWFRAYGSHELIQALLCVDGVALAPHRQVDVKALDVDFYVNCNPSFCMTGSLLISSPLGILLVQGVWTTLGATICLITRSRPDPVAGAFLQAHRYARPEAQSCIG